MKYDLIIWDFNGTLVDDVNIAVEAVNALLEKRNLPKVNTTEEYRSMFCFPVIEYYKKLGFDFDVESYESLAHEWMNEYLLREKEQRLIKNALDVLCEIKKRGISQIILSSCEAAMLKRELDALGILPYFDAVLGLDNIYAGGKVNMAKEWAKEKNFSALLIGDTAHDFDTAQAVGADCILYSGGHASKEKLSSCEVHVIETLSEVTLLI